MRFFNSTYQPDMGEDGLLFARVRSALAGTLICSSDPPPLRVATISQALYTCFSSTVDQEEILDRTEPDPSMSIFTFTRTLHRLEGIEHDLWFGKHRQQCR